MIYLVLTFFTVMSAALSAPGQSDGTIQGRITDAEDQSPLIGVNVVVQGTTLGASTNSDGRYEIKHVEPGIYTLEIRYIGHRNQVVPDVVVKPNRPTTIDRRLRPEVIEGEEVTVTASYFSEDNIESVSSSQFSSEELRRSPGAGQEISRVLTTVPGVASTGDTNQDLLVRGGSPSEVGFYVDNIPVPQIKHFPMQDGSSNGPIGIINTDLVSEINFNTGGFNSSYGNHLSAIGDITYREGNRDRVLGQLDLNMAGFGGNAEGPIGEDNKGSWIVSGRRSYLDVIADMINAGGAPRYSDAQAKGTYDLNKRNKLTALTIFGASKFTMGREEALDKGFDNYQTAEYLQNTTGLNWRHLYGSDMYSNLSLSYSFKNEDTFSKETATRQDDSYIKNTDQSAALRYVAYARLSDRSKLEFGAESRYVSGDFDYFFSSSIDRTGTVQPARNINQTIDGFNSAAFATFSYKPAERWSVSPGLRVNHNSFNSDLDVAPRIATSYRFSERLTFNAAGGYYYQNLPLYYLSQNRSIRELPSIRASHLIAGFDYMLTSATKLTVEVYSKTYNQVPVLPGDTRNGDPGYILDQMDFYDELVPGGKARARGIDFMVQKKMKDHFYGTVSGSFFRSRYRDHNGEWHNRNYDVKYLFNIIGGYRPNKKWEVSARWSYIGERPFTPIDREASRQAGTTVRRMAEFNERRLPAYHSLFLRMDRRHFFENTSITTYISLWNAYNRDNVHSYHWNSDDNEINRTTQFDLIPVGGVEFEF